MRENQKYQLLIFKDNIDAVGAPDPDIKVARKNIGDKLTAVGSIEKVAYPCKKEDILTKMPAETNAYLEVVDEHARIAFGYNFVQFYRLSE